MMTLNRIQQAPPGNPPHELAYSADGDALTVTLRTYRRAEPDPDTGDRPVELDAETTDTFDFTGTPDGQLDVASIETDLPVQPILEARRVDGQLTVTVLDWSPEA